MVATTATTATTAVTTTAATAVTIQGVAALGVVTVVLLITLLVSKELASASNSPRAQRFSKVVNIGIVPLMFAFGAIVISKLVGVLG